MAKGRWGWLWERLDALEFGESWFEPDAALGARRISRQLPFRYNEVRGRVVRGIFTPKGMLFVRIDHEPDAFDAQARSAPAPAAVAGGGVAAS